MYYYDTNYKLLCDVSGPLNGLSIAFAIREHISPSFPTEMSQKYVMSCEGVVMTRQEIRPSIKSPCVEKFGHLGLNRPFHGHFGEFSDQRVLEILVACHQV